ncbi:hypothetical protein [Streptomyces lasiicapitis]|uniref:hypothetical protein n=1 Tax=Streptomyces lasiicapitis TaxID=1923961 RepID=UPI0036BB9B87
MNYEAIAAAVVAVSGLLGLYIQTRRTTLHAAERIKRDLEILELLPRNSRMRQRLRDRVDDSLEHYLKVRVARDWRGAGVGLLFLLAAALIGWAGVKQASNEEAGVLFMAALICGGIGVFVFVISVRR